MPRASWQWRRGVPFAGPARWSCSSRSWPALALGVALLGAAAEARANCNVIPAATGDFRAAVGSTNRPYASPGDFVEVRVRPTICDRSSSGFVDLDLDGGAADDYVVTVLFTPAGGPRTAVVLAEAPVPLDLGACQATLGAGGSVARQDVNTVEDPGSLRVLDRGQLQFRFPDTDERLVVIGPNDDLTLAGPAKIVVTRRGAALPCGLASARCADVATTTPGVVACVDELFVRDGTCAADATDRDRLFGHFTALPPPNDLEALIKQPAITRLNVAIDADGNLLAPFDYAGILLRVGGIPVPQLARAGANVEAFAGGGAPPAIPNDAHIGSFSPEGIRLPPVFTPLRDPSDPGQATLFGSVDAPRGIVRIGRRGCVGGADDGSSCTADAQCASNQCGAPIFEFADRTAGSVGPVSLLGGPGGQFTAQLDTPVPLGGLAQSSATFAFTVYEAIDGVDRNGDGDVTDFVATLRDRTTGRLQPIGADGGAGPADGRAVVQLRAPPFRFPAVATDGDLLAFLESEATQFDHDTNQNGRVFDSLLRIFRLGSPAAIELTDDPPPTAESTFAVAGGAVAVTQGQVYFETVETALASSSIGRVNVSSSGQESNGGIGAASYDGRYVSSDGRYVTFSDASSNLVPGDTNLWPDVFVRDLEAGTTQRISVSSAGAQANNESRYPTISADGRFVAFDSRASTLVTGDTNNTWDVFVRDRQTGTTTRVSVATGGAQANGSSTNASISDDGRFVAFGSLASNLIAGDSNGTSDVFVRDRQTGTTELVSVGSAGAQGNGASSNPSISSDGRYVAFSSDATNLVGADTNGVRDVFVRDRLLGTTERVNVGSQGTEATSAGFLDFASISGDGRFVTFSSTAPNLVPDDTNGVSDVFVRDRVAGTTERASLSSADAQGELTSSVSALSADGRFVAFFSNAAFLVPGDENGSEDLFVRDRRTGVTLRIEIGDTTGGVDTVGLSRDGRFVVFGSRVASLVTGDTNGLNDLFVVGPLVFSPAADLTADGDADDRVLRHLDAGASPPVTPTTLCPITGEVATAGGRIAFLRDEAASPTSVACGGNGDADATDGVVHLATGAAVANLGCAAVVVGLSDTRIAALVSEPGEGADLDGDALLVSDVLHLASTASPPAACGGWTNTGLRGSELSVSGGRVALRTVEDAGGVASDLNLDGDTHDSVVRLVDGVTGHAVPLVDDQGAPVPPLAAEDFVLGRELLAVRTSEAAEGGTDRNGDGDILDDVLHVIDVATGELLNTGQAVRPCQLAECDPQRPYRVAGGTVRFLTVEADQGTLGGPVDCDLNDDGDCADLLVQVYNRVSRRTEVVAEVAPAPATPEATAAGIQSDPLAAPGGGGEDAAGGTDFGQVVVSTGRCIEDRQVACTVGVDPCAAGEFCLDPSGGTVGTCVRETGRTCYVDRPPEASGCGAGSSCAADFVVIAVSDGDGDGVPDALDNCAVVPNVDQTDTDGDGVGDACDLVAQTCADGTVAPYEPCDDGNAAGGDGCSAACEVEAGFVCNGEPSVCGSDADGDGIAVGDNCPSLPNPEQGDADGDGSGDRCDAQCPGFDPTAVTSVTPSSKWAYSFVRVEGLGFGPNAEVHLGGAPVRVLAGDEGELWAELPNVPVGTVLPLEVVNPEGCRSFETVSVTLVPRSGCGLVGVEIALVLLLARWRAGRWRR